ncbi:MAG: DUF1398 family protein [Chlamydiales bacterium]|nr:DUF1398 family protein [Chlamydiales bacterium]
MHIQELKKINRETLLTGRSFPEHLLAMIAEGVVSYQIDLVSGQATYFGKHQADTCSSDIARRFRLAVGTEWQLEDVKVAISSIQRNQLTYEEFLKAIAAAGVNRYIVDISNTNITYFGSQRQHVEPFPPALCDLVRSKN